MLLDRADWHPQNPHLVAGENAVAVIEVGHHMCFAHRVPQRSSDHHDAARQQRHQRDGHADPDGAVHGAGSELGDASPGAGLTIGEGSVRRRRDTRGAVATAGGPGGGPPGGGAGRVRGRGTPVGPGSAKPGGPHP